MFVGKISRKILRMAVAVVFSAIVLTVFRFYSILRPVAFGALYKELISAVIVLALCFLNYFILYPRLYARRRLLFYVIATVLTAMVATLLEFLLVYPQISEFVNRINDVSSFEYYVVMTLSLFIRDACFIFLFFSIRMLETAYDEYKDVNVLLQNTKDLLLARTDDKKRNLVTVRLSDIAYCRQN